MWLNLVKYLSDFPGWRCDWNRANLVEVFFIFGFHYTGSFALWIVTNILTCNLILNCLIWIFLSRAAFLSRWFHFQMNSINRGGFSVELYIVGSFADEPMQSWIVRRVASCGIIVVGIVVCGQSSQPQVWSQKLHILHIHAHIPLVYAHELVNTTCIS